MASSYQITKKQYDFLLPVYGIASNNNRLLMKSFPAHIGDRYYFIGDYSEFQDAMDRCKYLD